MPHQANVANVCAPCCRRQVLQLPYVYAASLPLSRLRSEPCTPESTRPAERMLPSNLAVGLGAASDCCKRLSLSLQGRRSPGQRLPQSQGGGYEIFRDSLPRSWRSSRPAKAGELSQAQAESGTGTRSQRARGSDGNTKAAPDA